MSFYLAFKELWHNRGRFLLVAMVVALITTLVLFIAALAQGLGDGYREYIGRLNGELLVYQANTNLSTSASRLGRSLLANVRRVDGVEEAGQVSFTSATLVFPDDRKPLDIGLIGVEPGMPGEPPALQGVNLSRNRSNEAVLDRNTALRGNIKVGDTITVKSIQGTEEKFYPITVVGISDKRQNFLQPSVFVPYLTWDRIRPKGSSEPTNGEFISNIIVAKLKDPADWQNMAKRIEREVNNTQVVDRVTAYTASPGYSAQQSTLNTQRYFTLLIGILVLGGFFQIQTLQKVAQIGMLRAIGTSRFTVGAASMIQIVTVNAVGVLIGTTGAVLLSLGFPPAVPITFTPAAVASAVVSLLIIGPLGGLVSVWVLSRVEPLRALGLAQ